MVPEAGRAEEAQRAAGLKKVPLKIRHRVLTDIARADCRALQPLWRSIE